MTTHDLDRLLAVADLADRTDRLMLADVLEEAGRDGEAELLRDLTLPVLHFGGKIVAPELLPKNSMTRFLGAVIAQRVPEGN